MMTITVKKLEWSKSYEDGSGYISYETSSILGRFSVYRVKPDERWIAERPGMGTRIGDYDTEAEAKAAAQADYSARILTAIEPVAAESTGCISDKGCDLSIDARTLLTAWFMGGHKTSVEVGGATAKSRLTGRAKAALRELEANGYITAEPVGEEGRMLFQGTNKRDGRLSLAEMERHGDWSPTEPNPDASEASKAKPTANLHIGVQPA